MIIPIESLQPDTLYSLVEAFVLREGTDYGAEETTLADKVTQVMAQLKDGSVVLVYSELHESVNLVPRNELQGTEQQSY